MVIRGGLTALGVVLVLAFPACAAREAESVVSRLPSSLTNADFWRLSTEWSEPDGYFRSDTPTSNELLYQHVIPSLQRRIQLGEVYLGVGPEQNFTYIAAVRPTLGIIVDIRYNGGGNTDQQIIDLLERRRARNVSAFTTSLQMRFRAIVPPEELPLALWVAADTIMEGTLTLATPTSASVLSLLASAGKSAGCGGRLPATWKTTRCTASFDR